MEEYKRIEPTSLFATENDILPSMEGRSGSFTQKLLVEPFGTAQADNISELAEEKKDLAEHPFLVDLFGTKPKSSEKANDRITSSPGRKFRRLTNRRNRILASLGKENIKKIRIPKHHVGNKVVLYEVEVANNSYIWNMWLRFEEFYKLHLQLVELATEYDNKFGPEDCEYCLPPFPFKQPKLIVNHKNERFIKERRSLLENYLQRVLEIEGFKNYECFITFLLPPRNEYEVPQRFVESPARTINKSALSSGPLEISWKDEITAISIERSKILADHTLYYVDLVNENKTENHANWTVLKRFGDFCKFDAKLRSGIATKYPDCLKLLPKFPPKSSKIFTNHADPVFIERRRILLNSYCQDLIKYPVFRRHQITVDFFLVCEN